MNWSELKEVMTAALGDASLGDVAALKLGAQSDAPERVQAAIRRLPTPILDVSLSSLRQLPEGTLGREYARFLDDNGLEHFELSDRVLSRFRDDPFTIRYTLTHDLHHLLAGFDTGIAGELGVAAFTAAQDTGYLSERYVRFARWLVAFMSPSQAAAAWHNVVLGIEMGRAAELIVAAPLEEWMELPLEEVRLRLGISPADRARVRPSGTSLYAQLMYRLIGRELPKLPQPA